MAEGPCYTVIADLDDSEVPSEASLRTDLEKGDIKTKIVALKKVILLMLQGERVNVLMTIIRFVMTVSNDDHTLKKLLLLYWEVVPKTSADGKLLHEMILVCDAYRRDLQHPNEFIRGSTLRFLCKLKEPELIEPLMPTIRDCLANRHSYVRRNAVLAICTIFKNFEHLVPDAPELIHNFLETEQDASCKRNAFMMLIAADQKRALDYLSTCIEHVQSFNEIMQLVTVELVGKVCRGDPVMRPRFIRVINSLLESSSNAVRYEAAGVLVTLLSAPKVVSAAVACYVDLILKEADNNVKLIVLDRLADLKNNPQHERVMQTAAMDILRVLSASDLQVRRKTLDLALSLLCTRNAVEIAALLKKELTKTSSEGEFEKMDEYRQLLVRALHITGVKFPETAVTIVPQLMEFLSDSSGPDVILFVREAFERMPALRSDMLAQLLANFGTVKASKVCRSTLWIVGEYAQSAEDIKSAFQHIRTALGPMPIVDTELRAAADQAAAEAAPEEGKVVTRTRITADGTYATESSYVAAAVTKTDKPALRKMLLEGEFFVASALAAALTKMALRFQSLPVEDKEKNSIKAEAMLIMATVVHVGKSGLATQPIDDDTHSRVMVCLRVLSDPAPELVNIFLVQCSRAFSEMLVALHAQADASQAKPAKDLVSVQADDLITFRSLKTKEELTLEDQFEADIKQATGSGEGDAKTSKLSKVFQLSGFSDPVYAEAYIHVHQYDILLDVLVVNQTGDTLQGLTLELATHGDLKLTEKPSTHTLGPHDFCSITANVKVSSTETGIIYGNIVYDISGTASDRNVVVLNDIHIDIMDYITPAFCSDSDFRNMWSEFEWENKVAVRTTIPTLRAYLDHLLATTNMRCLTPKSALQGECDFLAANLYARSVFGEDALANVSIEKMADGQITGHIRIRSKTQGIALSLGDKITYNQKAAQADQA